MSTPSVPAPLSGPKLALLKECFSKPAPLEFLELYQSRPRPSRLRQRLYGELSIFGIGPNDRHSREMLDAVFRSVNRSWENYTEGFVAANEFLRTPFGVPYQIVADIPSKGRGMIASKDIEPGELILQESPVLLSPSENANPIMFFLLPQRALEAILLLHDARKGTSYADRMNIPHHRLLDHFEGIMSTNSFGDGEAARTLGGNVSILLLRGSLFNHSDQPNVERGWDGGRDMMIFKSLRKVRAGEELVINYMGDESLTEYERAGKLRAYGILESVDG